MGLSIIIRFRKNHPRYNILFISLDALRADHLGCYGYKRNTSPFIDSVASKGCLFTQAISQSSWTSSSLAFVVTSFYPDHGLIEEGYSLSPLESKPVGVSSPVKVGVSTKLA